MTAAPHIYLLLFSLYWAQGLPVGFMTHALPVILRAEGLSLAHIGGFGLLMLPWSIKVFWAPLIDRQGSVEHGHYRSWIIPMQLCSVSILVALSFLPIQALDQPVYLALFFVLLLSMNLVGATQDIATDGLAVNILNQAQQQWGNTFQVIGSRLGFIVGGGAVLWALDYFTWQATFLCLAALVLLNTIAIFLFKEPTHKTRIQSTQHVGLWTRMKQYFEYFTSNVELRRWLWVLLTFKIADGLSGPLLKPLMVDLGLSFSQIGVYVTMLGAFAALVGAAIAGFSLKIFSRTQALVLFSFLKATSLAGYAWLAWQYEKSSAVTAWLIYTINACEDLTSAMLLVVMLTLVMQYSRKQFAGTDFTFQVAIMATVSGGLYMLSGILGEYFGYATYLSYIVCVSLVLILPIFYWGRVQQQAKQ